MQQENRHSYQHALTVSSIASYTSNTRGSELQVLAQIFRLTLISTVIIARTYNITYMYIMKLHVRQCN